MPFCLEQARVKRRAHRQISLIDTGSIRAGALNDRPVGDVSGLMRSIRRVGLLAPILVRAAAGGYELIAGTRRLAACRALGMSEVECIVMPALDEECLLAALGENGCRTAPSPDAVQALRQALSTRHGYTGAEIDALSGECVGESAKSSGSRAENELIYAFAAQSAAHESEPPLINASASNADGSANASHPPHDPKAAEAREPTDGSANASHPPHDPKAVEAREPTDGSANAYHPPHDSKAAEAREPTDVGANASRPPHDSKAAEAREPTDGSANASHPPHDSKAAEAREPTAVGETPRAPRRSAHGYIRDERLIVNAVTDVVDKLRGAGVDARLDVDTKGECVRVQVSFPHVAPAADANRSECKGEHRVDFLNFHGKSVRNARAKTSISPDFPLFLSEIGRELRIHGEDNLSNVPTRAEHRCDSNTMRDAFSESSVNVSEYIPRRRSRFGTQSAHNAVENAPGQTGHSDIPDTCEDDGTAQSPDDNPKICADSIAPDSAKPNFPEVQSSEPEESAISAAYGAQARPANPISHPEETSDTGDIACPEADCVKNPCPRLRNAAACAAASPTDGVDKTSRTQNESAADIPRMADPDVCPGGENDAACASPSCAHADAGQCEAPAAASPHSAADYVAQLFREEFERARRSHILT